MYEMKEYMEEYLKFKEVIAGMKKWNQNMKQNFKMILFLLALIVVSSCAILSENKKEDYGILKSAVMFSADKVIGEYGDEIPDDFNHEKFIFLYPTTSSISPGTYNHQLWKVYGRSGSRNSISGPHPCAYCDINCQWPGR